MLTLILGWLGNLLGGPFATAAVNAYKAKLEAGNTHERIAADLAAKDIDLQIKEREVDAKIIIAEQGNWFTRSPRPIIGWSVGTLLVKLLVWDKVIGSLVGCSQAPRGTCQIFTTDPLDPNLWYVVAAVVVSYFGHAAIVTAAQKRKD